MDDLNILNKLKVLIKLLLFVFCGSYFLYLIKILFAFMENDLSYLNYSSQVQPSNLLIVIILLKAVSKGVFFIGCYYLIKILNFDKLDENFTSLKISLFKKAGKLIFASSWIGGFIIGLNMINNVLEEVASLKTNIDFYYSVYFGAITGLFLIILSKILEKALALKQENDLTI